MAGTAVVKIETLLLSVSNFIRIERKVLCHALPDPFLGFLLPCLGRPGSVLD